MIHSYKQKPAVQRFAKRVLNNRHLESGESGAGSAGGQQLIGTAGQTHHPIFVKLHGNRRLAVGGGSGNGGTTSFRARGNDESIVQQGFTVANKDSQQPQSPQSMQNMFSATYQPSSNRYIPKLLLPRFTRPKMYSLNGYIPKPNMNKFSTSTTTTASSQGSTQQFGRNKSGRKSADKQLDKVSNGDETKRRRVSGHCFLC